MLETTTTTTTEPVDDWGAKAATKYSKLAGKVAYDHEAAEQLADAYNEIDALKLKIEQLKMLTQENNELNQFVWRSENGYIAIHNIGNDHLGNLMLHLLRRGRGIPRAIRGEAIARGVVVPAVVPIEWEDKSTRELGVGNDREDIR